MLPRALDARGPFAWFTADEIYGQARYLRAWLEEWGVSYVVAPAETTSSLSTAPDIVDLAPTVAERHLAVGRVRGRPGRGWSPALTRNACTGWRAAQPKPRGSTGKAHTLKEEMCTTFDIEIAPRR